MALTPDGEHIGPRHARRWTLQRVSAPRNLVWYRSTAVVVGGIIALALAPVLGGGSGVYSLVWTATLGSGFGIGAVLTTAAPLLVATLAVCIPYRMGLFNIGANGQMYFGAWAAAAFAFYFANLSGPILITVMLLAAAAGGSLWILGPALARAYLGVNEIVTTLLMNFVSGYWLIYWATKGSWRDQFSGGGVESRLLPTKSQLPLVTLGTTQVQVGFFVGIGLALVAWLWFRTSKMGYEVVVLRASQKAGHTIGIPVRRRVVNMMLLGGMMGGLAGAIEMMGDLYRYSDGISTNTGYIAIMIAVLAGGSELVAIPMTLAFALMIVGGNALQIQGVSSDVVIGLFGLILLLAAAGDALARYKIVRTVTPTAPPIGAST